jgi:hypothetical protein
MYQKDKTKKNCSIIKTMLHNARMATKLRNSTTHKELQRNQQRIARQTMD